MGGRTQAKLDAVVRSIREEGGEAEGLVADATSEAETVAKRAVQAFELLQADCKAGTLKLDLEPKKLLMVSVMSASATS